MSDEEIGGTNQDETMSREGSAFPFKARSFEALILDDEPPGQIGNQAESPPRKFQDGGKEGITNEVKPPRPAWSLFGSRSEYCGSRACLAALTGYSDLQGVLGAGDTVIVTWGRSEQGKHRPPCGISQQPL
jgi:hypothetical protein